MAGTGLKICGEVLVTVDKMTDSEAGRLLKAMAAYARGMEIPALPERLVLLFEAVKAMMDRDAASAACGKQGGRPRKRSGEQMSSGAEESAAQRVKTAPAGEASTEGPGCSARGCENPPEGKSAPEMPGKTADEAAEGKAPEKEMPEERVSLGGHSLPKGCAFVEDDGIPLPWDDWTPSAAYASVPEQSGRTGMKSGAQTGLPAPSAPAADNAADLSDVEEAYRAQGIPLGPWAKEDIAEFMNMGMEKGLLLYALEQAVSANCLKWSYCRGVLNNLHRQGVRRVSDAGKKGKPGALRRDSVTDEDMPMSPLLKEALEKVRQEDRDAAASRAGA